MATGKGNDIEAANVQYANGLEAMVLISEGWLSGVKGRKIILRFKTIIEGPKESEVLLAVTQENLMTMLEFLANQLPLFDLPQGN